MRILIIHWILSPPPNYNLLPLPSKSIYAYVHCLTHALGELGVFLVRVVPCGQIRQYYIWLWY